MTAAGDMCVESATCEAPIAPKAGESVSGTCNLKGGETCKDLEAETEPLPCLNSTHVCDDYTGRCAVLATGDCKVTDPTPVLTCASGNVCIASVVPSRSADGKCKACITSSCKACSADAKTCTECLDGKGMTATSNCVDAVDDCKVHSETAN